MFGAMRSPRTANDGAASGPRLKSPSGMFISSREPAKAGRDELAERHQVVLVVAVEAAVERRGARRDAGRRVGVAGRRSCRAAGRSARPARRCWKCSQQRLPVVAGRAARAAAGSPSRAPTTRSPRAASSVLAGPAERRRQALGGELLVLRHVALQQRDARARPLGSVKPTARSRGDRRARPATPSAGPRASRPRAAARCSATPGREAGAAARRCRRRRATARSRRAANRHAHSRWRSTESR